MRNFPSVGFKFCIACSASLCVLSTFSFTDLSELCTQENVTTPAALFDSKQNELLASAFCCQWFNGIRFMFMRIFHVLLFCVV